MNRRDAAGALCTAALLMVGCAAPSRRPIVAIPGPFREKGLDVVVDGLFTNGYGAYQGVSGTVTNVSGGDLVSIIMSFDVLDESGAKVSSAVASTTGLKSQQRWRFQAVFMNPYAIAFRAIAPGNIVVYPPR